MARTIPTASIAKLAQSHGVEPVIIIEVSWALIGKPIRYATKDVTAPCTVSGTDINIPGKIQSIGNVDSVVAITLNETSEEFDLVLNDADGSIKEILDFNDIMLRDVSVFQWFEGLNFEDRFLIFQGKINSPISWSETDRTVKFSVVSQLEDKDVGFSPEEGNFPDLPSDMVGKVWPECFGTTVHQKAIQVDFKFSGNLGEPVGLRDFTLPPLIGAHNVIRQFLFDLALATAFAAGVAGFSGLDDLEEQLEDKAAGLFVQAAQKEEEISNLNATLSDQIATERSSFRVIGGEHFPRGTLKLDINGAIFTGSFTGPQGQQGSDRFFVSSSEHPEEKNYPPKIIPSAETISGTSQGRGFSFPTGNIPGDQAGPFFAQGGTSIKVASAEPLRYFVSITPGTVLKVTAFATLANNERVLIDVPRNRYTVFTQSYGSVSVTVVKVLDALSKLEPPFEDTIYVTYQSTIGPNPIDVMTYLIGKYADISFDPASFAECRDALDAYPMHFCLTQKKNIVTVLKELAFMSRTAISIKNGKFFCRYLPAEPQSIFTFSENNVLTQSIELGFTDTEDLVTKYVANWREHGAQDEDNKVVIRYNVKKYGTHEEAVDFYAYNYLSAIVKTLSFWINRRGHTWKKLTFQAALDALNVETFDGVTLDFAGDYASNGPVLGWVEQGNYNINANTLDFTIWTGVRAGEMDAFPQAYPQNISVFTQFPDPVAQAAGFGGGDGPGNDSSGNILRIGRPAGVSITFNFKKDPNTHGAGDALKKDTGGNTQSDQGDTSPGAADSNDTGNVVEGAPPPPTPGINDGIGETNPLETPIDIRTTKIIDSANPGQSAVLATFFEEITDEILKAKTGATWKDIAEEKESIFDFKFSEENQKFGAGTAFLKDN